jgi:hypothetical protein
VIEMVKCFPVLNFEDSELLPYESPVAESYFIAAFIGRIGVRS